LFLGQSALAGHPALMFPPSRQSIPRARPCVGHPRLSCLYSRRLQDVDAHGSSPWADGPRDKPGQGAFGYELARGGM